MKTALKSKRTLYKQQGDRAEAYLGNGVKPLAAKEPDKTLRVNIGCVNEQIFNILNKLLFLLMEPACACFPS